MNLKMWIVGIAILFLTPTEVYNQSKSLNFSYPPLVCGSTWGNVFQQYYKLGDFSAMLKLTSDLSLKKYGKYEIITYYKHMNFGYKIKLISWNKTDSSYSLNYETVINATQIIIRMELIAGDTAKLLLPDNFHLQEFFLYK
jgi:hypothetical protein